MTACGARSDVLETDPPANDIDEPPIEELCNGRDDDGDGEIDEDIPPLVCGSGACEMMAPGCIDGRPGDCTPGMPSSEVCNNIDDDCDGEVDEELGFGIIAGPLTVSPQVFRPNGIVPTPNGLLLAWRQSFMGQNPTPSGFVRRLDVLGQPSGMTQALAQDPIAHGPSLAASTDGRFVAGTCRRFGTEDRPSWFFVNESGAALAEHPVMGGDEPCTTEGTSPQILWTGQRHLFAWITSSSDLVNIESSDADGNAASTTQLLGENLGDLAVPPRLVQYRDRVAVVAGFRPDLPASQLGVFFHDLAGNFISQVILAAPTPMSQYLQARAAVNEDGVILIVSKNRFDDGWLRARVAFDGTVVSPPEVVSENLDFRDLQPRRGGGYWGAASDQTQLVQLIRFDDAGEQVERFLLPSPGLWPVLTPHGGRVTVAYSYFPFPDVSELVSVTLGCF